MSFYFVIGDDFFVMDATTKVSSNFTGKLSTHPTADRRTASDNYRAESPTCNMTGTISSVKGFGNGTNKSPTEYIDGILKAIDDQVPVSLRYRLDEVEEDDWFITSFSLSSNNTNYTSFISGNDVIMSVGVSISFQRARIARGLQFTFLVDDVYLDRTVEASRASASTQAFGDTPAEQETLTRSQRLRRSAANNRDLAEANFGVFVDGVLPEEDQ